MSQSQFHRKRKLMDKSISSPQAHRQDLVPILPPSLSGKRTSPEITRRGPPPPPPPHRQSITCTRILDPSIVYQ
ncbi:hypothetical protein BU15DRAFT_76342 [Melanogaster broomeanus]|nr:hypothetical protein BU15DRAFT_76342 [Melanogaster broomeanus]